MVISLLETVIITNVLHHSSMKYQEVPRWVRLVVLKHIATLICYKPPVELQFSSPTQTAKGESDTGGGASLTSSQKTTFNQGTWKKINLLFYFALSNTDVILMLIS